MTLSIFAFFLSLTLTFGLIRYQHLHQRLSSDSNLQGPQKFHGHAVTRIGGVGVFLSLVLTSWWAFGFLNLKSGALLLQICACALPAFLVGLLEDITKIIGIKMRLVAVAISAVLSGIFLNTWITHIDVPGIDWLLSIGVVSMIFTILAITGLTNAYNIIDGFNGLSSMVGIISLFAIGYVTFKVGDPVLVSSCLIVLGAVAGFFIWNYPKGLIFLGDGGAYLIGYLVATLSILAVARNPSVSPWFALLVNAYPIFETLFTIWRRKVHQGKNPGLPDGTHFHSLIYRRIIHRKKIRGSKQIVSHANNARTSQYLWLLSSMAVSPAIIWWQTTWILQGFTLLFCISYTWAYNAIVKFKTPWFLKLFK